MDYISGQDRIKPWEYSWEYAELSYVPTEYIYVLNIYGSEGSEVCEIRQDPEKGDVTIMDARNRTIAEMGIDGWELVSIVKENTTVYQGHESLVLYFKRMINPEV